VGWGVRLLCVAEGGSRAAGLAHSASDLDVRFIYARPLRYCTILCCSLHTAATYY
jgi:predicted nucleotidyltransferase